MTQNFFYTQNLLIKNLCRPKFYDPKVFGPKFLFAPKVIGRKILLTPNSLDQRFFLFQDSLGQNIFSVPQMFGPTIFNQTQGCAGYAVGCTGYGIWSVQALWLFNLKIMLNSPKLSLNWTFQAPIYILEVYYDLKVCLSMNKQKCISIKHYIINFCIRIFY